MTGESAKPVILGETVSKEIVNNETLGYFIGMVYLFLTHLVIDKERLRFRQHLPNEMAHYAADCWDAEIECSYGWIECVGITDRSPYDLWAHSLRCGIFIIPIAFSDTEKSGIPLVAHVKLEPREIEAMREKEAPEMKASLESKGEVEFYVSILGKTVVIMKKMTAIITEKKELQRVFPPSVNEPSFGIGRIIYCLFEHSFYTQPSKSEDVQLNVFRFPPLVAPIKCTIFPLIKTQEFDDVAQIIAKSLTAAGIFHIDTTVWSSLHVSELPFTCTSIGKRYAWTDEIGVPFAVTVDSADSVMIQERGQQGADLYSDHAAAFSPQSNEE
ncbi:hypothetical protein ZIOFF_002642 [Zingiber officinale]|uniref:Anticodon-binding domain-containing protein n=1 Tax=Zingiber officinale TaxID=94328 RepID=A0A8J5IR11_ZINOF|nr:hypothetical protein ZIOFF_002642 [Zingiber officinale]